MIDMSTFLSEPEGYRGAGYRSSSRSAYPTAETLSLPTGHAMVKSGHLARTVFPKYWDEILADAEASGWYGSKPRTTFDWEIDRGLGGMATSSAAVLGLASALRASSEFVATLGAFYQNEIEAEDPTGPGTELPGAREVNVVLRIVEIGPLEYAYIND